MSSWLRYHEAMAADDVPSSRFRVPIPPTVSPAELVVVGLELLAEAARRSYANSALVGDREDDVFTTKHGEGPPGITHRRWLKLAPLIPGAHRPSRWWVVSRRAYFEFVRSHPQRRPRRGPKG